MGCIMGVLAHLLKELSYTFKSAMHKRNRLSQLAIKILSFSVYANIMKTSLDEKYLYPLTLKKSKSKYTPLNVMSFPIFE